MKSKYEALFDNEASSSRQFTNQINGESHRNEENTVSPNNSLNNIYGKIVKIRKELEKSYNLFYSYNLIVSTEGEGNINPGRNYADVYQRNDALKINANAKNNLTLNKINALTNSFFMNVETLRNTYSFLGTNNMNGQAIMRGDENVIWERRIETLTNEANSYIKTLDGIYKTNLSNTERNARNAYNERDGLMGNSLHRDGKKAKKKMAADTAIGYLHNEREILKEVENNLKVFHIQGMSTLELIRKQNKFLKNVRKKVIDIYNYVGLSSSLTDTIKKTHKQNLIIVIVGMVLSLLFFYVLYKYVRG
ncbi:syntaxin, putative [Plasmodium knowlesi strain H]|uniref:Syntaxin, putative n=3 Tax=Plasmodium knowlesi TaxID=5850 RepID=A0A5K1VJE7_PLAKH|nr:protein transport protein BOS1, putative [Plasmodium knowlesi strain H]OTN64916.1 putative Syntaxin [Plasmodium knowlesi]CAA9988137.1 protein transport protein BOS1, putative [Plasmodium knowlesi strain H]SBO20027.1 syntaxin, putative [Plasmodium knowlesi strain H]SBO20801.1 syntaxin, putative [Plasmodium knowlesi strain H]VVS77611.1 protein transport protein BOS1, putative [Plasmodium knowlesi strain H]|eukprot:XP_002259113.1 hypothetical protein, conserved in Plasmodium species [Plasmodium knowlesi strain H]